MSFKTQERAENYTPEELSQLKLVSETAVSGFNDHYSGNGSNLLVVYGGRGLGKSLYAYKTAIDHNEKQGFGKVGNLVYQADHKLEFRVDGKSYDVDLGVVPFMEEGSKMIFHDFHYMADACVSGEFDQEDLARVLKMADEISKNVKVVMITDTHMAKYYDPENVTEGGTVITNPDVVYYFSKFGFVNENDVQDTRKYNQDVRDSMQRGIQDRSTSDRFMTMNPLQYTKWLGLFNSQFQNITADDKSYKILFFMNKNPRRLIRAIDYFGKPNGDNTHISFNEFTNGIISRTDDPEISKILGIENHDKKAINNIINTSSEFLYLGWFYESNGSRNELGEYNVQINGMGNNDANPNNADFVNWISGKSPKFNAKIFHFNQHISELGRFDFRSFEANLKSLQYYRFNLDNVNTDYDDILENTKFSESFSNYESIGYFGAKDIFGAIILMHDDLLDKYPKRKIKYKHMEELEKIGVVKIKTKENKWDTHTDDMSIPENFIEFAKIIKEEEIIKLHNGGKNNNISNILLRRTLFDIYASIHETHPDPINEVRKVKEELVSNSRILKYIDDSGDLTKNTIESMVKHPQNYTFPSLLRRVFPDVFDEDPEITG